MRRTDAVNDEMAQRECKKWSKKQKADELDVCSIKKRNVYSTGVFNGSIHNQCKVKVDSNVEGNRKMWANSQKRQPNRFALMISWLGKCFAAQMMVIDIAGRFQCTFYDLINVDELTLQMKCSWLEKAKLMKANLIDWKSIRKKNQACEM